MKENLIMKKTALLVTIFAIALFISCKTGVLNSAINFDTLTIYFTPKSGSHVSGNATFTVIDGKVNLVAKISGLKPGTHAIHIHEKSDCSAADGSSAGGHWNPTFKKHGKLGVGEAHKGDIGNFTANENGEATIIFTTAEWCIGCGDATRDIMGKGLIVHEGADDYTSQPAGNSGARVACSAIIK